MQTVFEEHGSAWHTKRKKAKSKQVFKPYQQHQAMLLPPSLEELIPESHLVRVVNKTIDGLNLEPLLATYVGGGTSAFHPLMMLKTLVYAYLSKTYASRRIAKALREDINFMWLSGMNRPDFRTINLFRSSRLKEVIDQVFGSMVLFLEAHGYIDLNEYFVDGTKLRADSNRHKVVWAKNTKRYKENTQQKIQELLQHIEHTNDEENQRYGDKDLEELGEQTTLSSTDVKEQIQRLKDIVQTTVPNKHTMKSIKTIENKLLPKLEGYEKQEQTLAGRNSYAKTDTDATVFRMKDDQLLPAYNLLMGTQNQFILNYSFHQRKASETDGLSAHLEHFHQITGHYPACVMGDSAYGSQENYALLEQHRIGNYLKYNTFHLEQKKKYCNDPYRKENFTYDLSSDTYTCAQGRPLMLKEIKPYTTDNGYQTTVRIYQAVECRDCPVAAMCKRGAGNRTIQVNPTLERYRAQARANLTSERGLALRRQRNVDVETVFADIKYNQGYGRCRLRGKAKVNVEIALLGLAHNTKKIALNHNNTSLSQSAVVLAYLNPLSVSLSFAFQRTFWSAP
jgi:transposase